MMRNEAHSNERSEHTPRPRVEARAREPERRRPFPIVVALGPIIIAWLLSLAASFLLPSEADALAFGVEFRSSRHQVVGGDTYDSLVVEHGSGALLASQTLVGIDSAQAVALAVTPTDYSALITPTFMTGTSAFQIGTDWGRGGATQAVHVGSGTMLDAFVTTNDSW